MGLSRAILLNILICIVGVCTNQITTSLNGFLNRDRNDLSTFNLSCIVVVHSVSPPESLTSVIIARKTYGESEFSKLVVLETYLSPTSIGDPQLKICEDTGTYKCISMVDNGTSVQDIVLGEEVTTAALVSVNLALTPLVEGEDVTLIDAGVNRTYTCNATGPPDIKIDWKFQRHLVVGKIFGYDALYYPKVRSDGTPVCPIHSSVIHKSFEDSDNGTTLFCGVTDKNGKELAKKQLNIVIRAPEKGYFSNVVSMKQSLTMLLSIYICKTFVTD
ncbi:uncharacterized protein LOC106078128 isoform X3 [Biomphalaria glabrata]|uniref:Uncharacterized protein LOC106078128 isoform X3 n=1 Tax=Biomphalaria glabrata TaxID=6526 RepID=A0A9W3B7E7_BIOGL|nr:uncharacterized protein LOC106078128 isoform X3 [Biomphalaria glabrata]